MTFKVPDWDIRFCLNEIAVLKDVLSLPGFEEVDSDLIDAVLAENAKLVENVVAPLNPWAIPSRLYGATASSTPPRFRRRFPSIHLRRLARSIVSRKMGRPGRAQAGGRRHV